MILFILMALFAPVLSPYDPLEQNISESLAPPSPDHWFGADKLGRDILSRMLYGARISLATGLGVVVMASLLGTTVGLLAGYAGGWWDEGLMRVTDIFFAFPSLILAMAIAGALGPSLQNALIAVAVVTWPIYARLVRGQVLVIARAGVRRGCTRDRFRAWLDPAPPPAAQYDVAAAGADQL